MVPYRVSEMVCFRFLTQEMHHLLHFHPMLHLDSNLRKRHRKPMNQETPQERTLHKAGRQNHWMLLYLLDLACLSSNHE